MRAGGRDESPLSAYAEAKPALGVSQEQREERAEIVSEESSKIHLLSNTQFNGEEKLCVINLTLGGRGRLNHNEGTWLRLGAFDKSGWVQMRKKDNPSAVRTVTTDNETKEETKYNLSGMAMEKPHGVYIQSRRKKVAK